MEGSWLRPHSSLDLFPRRPQFRIVLHLLCTAIQGRALLLCQRECIGIHLKALPETPHKLQPFPRRERQNLFEQRFCGHTANCNIRALAGGAISMGLGATPILRRYPAPCGAATISVADSMPAAI